MRTRIHTDIRFSTNSIVPQLSRTSLDAMIRLAHDIIAERHGGDVHRTDDEIDVLCPSVEAAMIALIRYWIHGPYSYEDETAFISSLKKAVDTFKARTGS